MNKCYSIVWNAARNMYVVASELARSGGAVKAQVCVCECKHSSLTQSEPALNSTSAKKLKRTALTRAMIAALGFSATSAIASDEYNTITRYTAGYFDEQAHELTDSLNPITYTNPERGAALYVAGERENGGANTTVTGTGLDITSTGGGAEGSADNVGYAIFVENLGILSLADSTIKTSGTSSGGIFANDNGQITLTGSSVNLTESLYTGITADNNSTISLIDTDVNITTDGTVLAQKGSTMNVSGGSTITLAGGQLRGVSDAFLNVSDSTVTSTGSNSTVWGYKAVAFDIKNSAITHSNASGSAVEVSSGSTLNISGNKSTMTVNSAGTGINSIASAVSIDGATIAAEGDGIILTSKGKSGFYDDLSALTLKNADVTSKTNALHVDSSTTINNPIVLTDTTLTAPTAIKLESNVTLESGNSTLTGNIDAGSTTSVLDLTQSTLTGSVNGKNSTLSLDDNSQWNMTGNSTVGTLTSNGSMILGDETGAAGTLKVGGTLTLQSDSKTSVVAGATTAITTNSATLDGALNLYTTVDLLTPESDRQLQSITLIDSQSDIVGNFSSVSLANIDTSALPDYLTLTAGIDAKDATNYVLAEGLSWYAGATSTREAHGTFTVNADKTFEVTSQLSNVTANTLWNGSTLTKEGDGVLILANEQNDYGATNINNGTLNAKDAASLGTGDVTVAKDALLMLGSGTMGNVLNGEGSLTKFGSGELTLTADNGYSGGTSISGGTLKADSLTALGSGDIDNAGLLVLNAAGRFNLADASIVTHGNAELQLAAGTSLNAKQLTQQADSTLSITLGDAASEPVITANDASLAGSLNISGIGNVKTQLKADPYTFTLIDSVNDIQGDFADLTIAGMEQKEVDFLTVDGEVNDSDKSQYQLTASLSWYADRDNAATDAHGTFTLGDAEGSFKLGTDLTNVDPNSTTNWDGKTLTKEGAGTLILSGNNDYTGGTLINDGTLKAASANALGLGKVDNRATLVLDANDTVNAAGGITTYTGATTRLAAGTQLDLGDSALTQESGSTLSVEIDSTSAQHALIAGNTATLDGALLVSDGSLSELTSDAQLKAVTLMDMDNDISGNFISLTMELTSKPDFLTVSGVVDGSQYLLTEELSWNAGATSATDAHGDFTLASGKNFEVTSALSDRAATTDWDGKSLTKLGAGKLSLSGINTYSGTTNVQEGTLWLNGTGVIGTEGSQQAVNVASDATLGGSNGSVVNGSVNNQGALVFGDETTADSIFTLNGTLTNSGSIVSGSSTSTPGNTLYINGDYVGDGGSLYLNTVLEGDDSATDMMVVTGNTSGKTNLYVNGIQGQDVETENGIKLVDVGGTSASESFELANQVQKGLYEYRLYQDENDWYLRSVSDAVTPDDGSDVTPDDGSDVTPDDGSDVTPDDGSDVAPVDPDSGGNVAPQYRADIGAYLGNQWMVRNLQMQTLYDREGSQYRSADGSIWARFKAGSSDSQAVGGNVDIENNYSQFQLGGDVLAWNNGEQSFTVGIMASYVNATSDSTGNRGADGSQFTADGQVDGYNLGLYASWFADAQTHQGMYIDSWYQYGIYNNSVNNSDAGTQEYDSTAHAVSLETGYRHDIALGNGNTVSLTPQAQVVWQNYDADSVQDNNGTRIDGQDSDSWTTRLGLRMDGKLYKGDDTVIQPFAEANWLHTSDDASVSFDGATVKQDIPTNRAELKVGIQADINKQWSIRAQVAGQKGSDDYGDLNGSLNLRYNW